jgi:hypothetical protein
MHKSEIAALEKEVAFLFTCLCETRSPRSRVLIPCCNENADCPCRVAIDWLHEWIKIESLSENPAANLVLFVLMLFLSIL